MDKKINEQVQRFVELSFEFTSADENYNDFIPNNGIIFTTNGTMGYMTINGQCNFGKQKSKLEQYEESLLSNIEKAKRYEEFIELRDRLNKYFSSLKEVLK